MEKILCITACLAILLPLGSCKNKKQAGETAAPAEIQYVGETSSQEFVKEGVPTYSVITKPQVDLASLPMDEEGYYILFDGTRLDGWRGYGKDAVPSRWTIEDGCLKFSGTGTGEAQTLEGGDIIFAAQFKNFELKFDWKVSKGGNSGVFYLAREVVTKNEEGTERYEPIYISSPEYQILDNANHPDAKLGKDGNRQSASLYDMIPAVPQNQNPFEEWNTAEIMVYQGTVVHYQNDENVLEYHLWTPQWTEMLQASKFSREAWPLAFELLNDLGGEARQGYIGFQDHGNDVWYKNIRIKVLD
jgi:hypothetical protein